MRIEAPKDVSGSVGGVQVVCRWCADGVRLVYKQVNPSYRQSVSLLSVLTVAHCWELRYVWSIN